MNSYSLTDEGKEPVESNTDPILPEEDEIEEEELV